MTEEIKSAPKRKRKMTKSAEPPSQLPPGVERDPRIGYDGPILGEWGVSGLKRASGYLLEEFHPNLRGRKADAVYTEMINNDPLLGGAYWAMESLVRQVEWRCDAPEGSGSAGQQLADWYEGARNDMDTPWDMTISEIMSMVPFGWAPTELNYKVRRGPENDEPLLHSAHDDGLFGFRSFEIRAQDTRLRWQYSDAGTLEGMWQLVPTEGKLRFIPESKMMIFRLRSRKNNPEGVSMYRHAYRPYYFGARAEEMEGIGLERNVAGMLVFELPVSAMNANAPQSEKQFRTLAENAVRDYRKDTMSGLVVPASEDRQGKTGFNVRCMNPEGADIAAADPIIKRLRTDKLIALLMQVLLLGSDKTGSYSLSSDMTDLLAMCMNAILRAIAETVNKNAFAKIARLNGFDPKLVPFLNYADIEKPDMLKLSQAILAATQSGVLVVDERLRSWYRDESRMPAEQDAPLWRLPFPDGGEPETHTTKQREFEFEQALSKRSRPRGRRFFTSRAA